MKRTIIICDGCGCQYDTAIKEYTIPSANATIGLYARTVDLCPICAVRIGMEFIEIQKEQSLDGKGVEHGETTEKTAEIESPAGI